MSSSSCDFEIVNVTVPPGAFYPEGECFSALQQEPPYVKHLLKMKKNAIKAILEHIRVADYYQSSSRGTYATTSDIDVSSDQTPTQNMLSFFLTSSSSQGGREKMEDASFFTIIDEGVVAGVFDGHGGIHVAQYASEAFLLRFSAALQEMHHDVYQAFSCLMGRIHQEVAARPEWDALGSAAVVVFIDKMSHCIYTATLGDCEANIYRNIKNKCLSIPLSCVRNWSYKRDAERAARALKKPALAKKLQREKNPKKIYFPGRHDGLNVSRAIGDVDYTRRGQLAISQKPKITMARAHSGDVVILASDGLKDFVPESEIAEIVSSCILTEEPIARKLVLYATEQKSSPDNVSVVTIKIRV